MRASRYFFFAQVGVLRLAAGTKIVRSRIGEPGAAEFQRACDEVVEGSNVSPRAAVIVMIWAARFWYASFLSSLVFLLVAGIVVADLVGAPPYSATAGAIGAVAGIPSGASAGVAIVTTMRRNRLLRKYGSLTKLDSGLRLSRKSEFCLPKSWDFWVWSVIGAAVIALGTFGKLGPGGSP